MSAAAHTPLTPSASSSSSSGFAPIPHVTHTDYTTRYRCTGADDDYAIHTHGNGICVLTLAPTHPLRRLNKTIRSVAWQGVSARALSTQDRSRATVSGKRKKGGHYLEPNSVLGQVECDDGSFYSLRATVHGKLVEINESLSRRAQLMVDRPTSDGFLALFLLAPKARALLSAADRHETASEQERDTAEDRKLTPEAQTIVVQPEAAVAAEPSTGGATEDAQVAAQREGRAWQSVIEYLTSQQYLDKRAHCFEPSAS